MNLARLLQSREQWKHRAGLRRRQNELLIRKARRLQLKLEQARAQVELLDFQLQALKTTSNVIPLQPHPLATAEIRVVCITIFVFALIPCNAISRVLSVLSGAGLLALSRIPHPSSIVNWVARAGLGLLAAVAPAEAPWIALIDSSISYGKAKILVCLRVSLQHFTEAKGAVGLADVECVGVEIRETTTGEDVREFLQRTFAKSGLPAAILKDQGSDLKRGVNLLREEHPQIQVIRDVGHVAAVVLKGLYEKNPVFARLLKIVDAARARLSNGDASALRPPKIRAKGRFQGISRIVEWANKIAELVGGSGRSEQGGLRQRLRDAVPGLCGLRFFLTRLARDCSALNEFLALLKNQGLNQESYRRARVILEELPARSKLKKRLLAWLNETLRIQCRLSIGQTPLVVSTDAIESLFGIVKSIIERMPAPEFSSLALATPLLCGRPSVETLRDAIARCPHQKLTDWRFENLPNTHRKAKHRLLDDLARNAVQETRHASSS